MFARELDLASCTIAGRDIDATCQIIVTDSVWAYKHGENFKRLVLGPRWHSVFIGNRSVSDVTIDHWILNRSSRKLFPKA